MITFPFAKNDLVSFDYNNKARSGYVRTVMAGTTKFNLDDGTVKSFTNDKMENVRIQPASYVVEVEGFDFGRYETIEKAQAAGRGQGAHYEVFAINAQIG